MKSSTSPASSASTRLERDIARIEIALPDPNRELAQDKEFFLVRRPAGWREVRMHDYPAIFAIPGLYEKVVYNLFECRSPEVIAEMVAQAWDELGQPRDRARVLDLGAGNGCVAEALAAIGAENFTGIDLHPEAAAAAERDRPGLYREFLVGDLLALPPQLEARWANLEVDLLTCVAALGFDDIPPEVFRRALSRVRTGGLVAFTLKRDFTKEGEESGFAALLRSLVERGTLDVIERRTYVHRKATSGDPLHYVAWVARVKHQER